MATKKKTREYPAKRKFNMRSDATVGTAVKTIEETLGLPEGSVRIQLPSGRTARSDKSILAPRKGYEM